MLALVALAAWASPANAQTSTNPDVPGGEAEETAGSNSVTIAVLPYGTTVQEIASVPEMAPGLISGGLGVVPITQTFLDISQGNRVNEDLYDGDLPSIYLRGGEVPPEIWKQIVDRANSAPAQIEPGLLASTVEAAQIPVTASSDAGLASLMLVNRDGHVDDAGPSGLNLVRTDVDALPQLINEAGSRGMVIAVAAGVSTEQTLLPAGIAAPGFHGDLTSASTRTDGVALSTDIAPTVLDHLGIPVPDAMNGTEIESEDDRDPAGVAELQGRLDHRPNRDDTVLLPLAIWLLLTGLASLIWRRRGARPALRLLALSCVWTPLLLLALAAPNAGPLVSGLTVGLGAPALALLTDRFLPGSAGLALACAASVLGYAVDVIAGSPLTALSILGPNPGAGVRFFGIGNELEAILTTLTVIGTGAWLDDRDARWAARRCAAVEASDSPRRGVEPRTAAITFLAVGAAAAAAFAPGRFGADVGAAIVLGVGASTAAVLALGLSRGKAIVAVIGTGAIALAALVAVDLVSGGAHLTRSVLGAGNAGDVLDVFDRRVRLMLHTFTHPVYPELLVVVVVLLVAGALRRDRVLAWFGTRRWARDGLLGALGGVLIGTIANDSGSVLLVIGTIYLAVVVGYYWALGASDGSTKPEADIPAA
jgi:hypothetical protein